jgi:hypothetical protein
LPASYTLHADGTAICLPGDVDARSTESALPSVHDATPKPVQSAGPSLISDAFDYPTVPTIICE